MLVYAHFDPDHVVQDYVLHALASMRPLCSQVRFVTTSRLAEAEQEKLRPLVDEFLEVENLGFDFFMWKSALRSVDLGPFDELVLMNSSVYGPFGDPASLFAAMRDRACQVWGITESHEHDRHVQSYFIVFRRPVLSSPAFRAFWDSVLPYRNKRQVIRSYEIGLTQWLEGNGIVVAAFCPWSQVVRYLAAHPRRALPMLRSLTGVRRRVTQAISALMRLLHRVHVWPTNPTVAFPEELLKMGVPFLKLEVLRDNPFGRDLVAIRARLETLGYPSRYLQTDRSGATRDGMVTAPAPTCPLCGSGGEMLHRGRGDAFRMGSPPCWSIRRCGSRNCGCAWIDPLPLESEIHKAYAGYYTHGDTPGRVRYEPPEYGPASRVILTALRHGLGLLGLYRLRETHWLHGLTEGDGRLLEVGCGDGSRLLDLQRRGWVVEGQEVDAQAARRARSRGLTVHEGSLEQCGLPEDGYDVILMSHVLEHLHRPGEVLRQCRKLLRPGGRLVVSTPNVESLGHRTYRGNWLALDPPRHLVIHSRRSLANLLREAGFDEPSVRTVAVNCELSALHSRDIRYHGWTDMDSMPRVGQELVPVAVQVAALLLHRVAPGSGEECLAVARRER
jgi:SAM-dependent methyltransferase